MTPIIAIPAPAVAQRWRGGIGSASAAQPTTIVTIGDNQKIAQVSRSD